MTPRFRNRYEAGRYLADELVPRYGGRPDVVVLALPRGGVPVGYEVAAALGAPLDVFVVRKLGMPGHEEFAIGAIAEDGVPRLNREVVDAAGLSEAQIQAVVARERAELERRKQLYRGTHPRVEIAGRTVIVVDDGLATGASMHAAVVALRHEHPARIVVAVPVAPADSCDEMRRVADEVVCTATPEPFHAVGLWYEDFTQTSDEEVRALLEQARASAP
jgi:predicted phosphoribosyltransferase